MIRKWLLKHRWVNEIGKILTALFWVWGAAQFVNVYPFLENPDGIFAMGVGTGLFSVIAVALISDVIVSVFYMIFQPTKLGEDL